MNDSRLSPEPVLKPPSWIEVEAWCERVAARLPGVVELGVILLSEGVGQPIGRSPSDMPFDRHGQAEALSRARDSKTPALLPLDRVEDGIAEVIAIPLKLDEGEAMVLAGIAELSSQQIELTIQFLQEASGWVVYTLSRNALSAAWAHILAQRSAFEITAELLDARSSIEANQAFVSMIVKPLGASRAVLIRRRLMGRARMVAVSEQSRFDRRQRLNDLTEQVGHEAILRREMLVWQHGDAHGSVLATLAEAHGDAALAAIPLSDASGEMRDVVVLHWEQISHMPDLALWTPLWVLLRPANALQERAGYGPLRRAALGLQTALARLFGPRALKAKMLTSLFLAFFLSTIFIDVPNTLPAETTIDDPGLRVLSAPVDGYLDAVFALPGDQVRAGQEVARLDTADLRLKEAELEAQLARFLAEEALSRQNRNLGAAVVAQAEAKEVRVRLAKARTDIERSIIRAHSDGMVVEGDLRQRIGSRISFGETLMQIAPRRDVEVKISVRNRDGDRLVPGLAGTLRLHGAPQTPLSVLVQRVKPGAEIIDGEARFVGYAVVEAGDMRLENGMQGVARLDLGQARLWQVWLRPAFEMAYLFFWRWLP